MTSITSGSFQKRFGVILEWVGHRLWVTLGSFLEWCHSFQTSHGFIHFCSYLWSCHIKFLHYLIRYLTKRSAHKNGQSLVNVRKTAHSIQEEYKGNLGLNGDVTTNISKPKVDVLLFNGRQQIRQLLSSAHRWNNIIDKYRVLDLQPYSHSFVFTQKTEFVLR